MQSLLSRIADDASGLTAMQYALIAALVAVVIMGATRTTGTQTSGTFSNLTAKMK